MLAFGHEVNGSVSKANGIVVAVRNRLSLYWGRPFERHEFLSRLTGAQTTERASIDTPAEA